MVGIGCNARSGSEKPEGLCRCIVHVISYVVKQRQSDLADGPTIAKGP